MPNSFIFNEWAGNRLFFQYLTGFFLKYIEFEPFVFFARMLTFLLISIPLAAVLKTLQIKNLYLVVIIQIYLLHQNYFGREFIFGDFEAKSLAYIFVLAGVYFLLHNKFIVAVIFSVLASYFHILVGGWFFVLIFLYSMVKERSIILLLKEGVIFIVLLVPFGLYLGKEIGHAGTVINGVNIDWVYVFFRNPHHLAPLSVKEMLPEIITEVSITGLLFIFTLVYLRKFSGELINKLYYLNVIVFTLLFLFLGVSLIDKNGFFLKFYLFRFAAIGCFLMYLYVLSLLKLIPKVSPLIKSSFILIGFYIIIAEGIETYKDIFVPEQKKAYSELIKYVTQFTDPKDIFLSLDDYELSFSRRTRREEFVSYKLVPGGGEKIYEWYNRILQRRIIADDISKLEYLKQKYRINYIISNHALENSEKLVLVFKNSAFSLYKAE